jgi:hypothetical protein
LKNGLEPSRTLYPQRVLLLTARNDTRIIAALAALSDPIVTFGINVTRQWAQYRNLIAIQVASEALLADMM